MRRLPSNQKLPSDVTHKSSPDDSVSPSVTHIIIFYPARGAIPLAGWVWGCLQASIDLHRSWSWEVLAVQELERLSLAPDWTLILWASAPLPPSYVSEVPALRLSCPSQSVVNIHYELCYNEAGLRTCRQVTCQMAQERLPQHARPGCFS